VQLAELVFRRGALKGQDMSIQGPTSLVTANMDMEQTYRVPTAGCFGAGMDQSHALPTLEGVDQLHTHYGSVPEMQASEPSPEGPDFRAGGMPTEVFLPQDQWSFPRNTGACPEGPDFRSGQLASADMACAPQELQPLPTNIIPGTQAWDQPVGTCAVPMIQSWDSMPGMDGSLRAKSMQSQTLGSRRLGSDLASVHQAALPTQVWDSIPAVEAACDHQPMQTQAWDSVGTANTFVHSQNLEHAALPTQGWDQMAGMTSLPFGFCSSIKSSGGNMETAMLPELPLRKTPGHDVRVREPVGSQVCLSRSFSQNFRGSSQRIVTPTTPAAKSSGIFLPQDCVQASSARLPCQMKQSAAGLEAPTPPVPTQISNASVSGRQMSYRSRAGSSAMVSASNDSWRLPARKYPFVGGSLQLPVRQHSQTRPLVRETTPPPASLVGGSLQLPVRQLSQTRPLVRETTPPPAYNRDVTPSPAYRRDATPPPAYQLVRAPSPSYIRDPTPPPAYRQQLQATPASTPHYPLNPLVSPDGASTPRMFGRMVGSPAGQQQQQQKQQMQQLQPQLQQPQSMPICSGHASERSASSPPLGMGGSEGSASRSSSFVVPKGSLGPYRSEHDGGMLFRTLDRNRDGMITAQEVTDWMSSSRQHHWTQLPPGMSPVEPWSARVPTAASQKCMTPPRNRSRTRRSHDSKWLLCCSNN